MLCSEVFCVPLLTVTDCVRIMFQSFLQSSAVDPPVAAAPCCGVQVCDGPTATRHGNQFIITPHSSHCCIVRQCSTNMPAASASSACLFTAVDLKFCCHALNAAVIWQMPPCNLIVASETVNAGQLVLGLAPNSTIAPALNMALLELTRAGYIAGTSPGVYCHMDCHMYCHMDCLPAWLLVVAASCSSTELAA